MVARDRALVVALLAAAAVALWLRVDTSALPEVGRFRDDAYYFFSWARSLAAGDGPCVTPGVTTSGVQLLWGVVLAAGAWGLGPASLPVLAHVLGLICHLLTACAIGFWLRGRGVAALCGALLYLGNPFLITEAQNGQETAIAGLAALILMAASNRGERAFVAAAVLATWARADLFALVPLLAWHRHGISVKALLAPGVALGAYLTSNWIVAGHVLQDSAAPIPWLFAQHGELGGLWWWLRPCLLGGPWAQVSPWLAGVLVFVAGRRFLRGRWRYLPLALTAAAAALGADDLEVPLMAAVLIALVDEDGFEREPLPFLALVLGWGAIVFLHYVVRHYPRPYYFAPMGVALVAAMVVFQARRPRFGALLALAVGALQVVAALEPPPLREWQEESRMAGRFLREFVAEAEPVGCFNAGIVGWLDGGPVLNLDGVVNRPAFRALRRSDLSGYLDAEGARFVIDVPVQFEVENDWPHASGRHFGGGFDPAADLEEIARFDVPGVSGDAPGTDSVRLYQRVGRGQRPSTPESSKVLGSAPGGGFYVLWHARAGETLLLEDPSGRRTELALGEAGVAFVLKVSTPQPGRYTLHTGDVSRPILVLESS